MSSKANRDDPPFVKMEFASRDGVEWLWAKPVELKGEVFFEVANIPFLTRGVSLHDVVGWRRAEEEGDTYIAFDGTIERASGYKTFTVTLGPSDSATDAFGMLRDKFGLEVETSDDRTYTVASPPTADPDELRQRLEEGVRRRMWSYTTLS